MSSTANDVAVEKQKFGSAIYNMAKERAATPEGQEELKPYSMDQFLDTLKRITDLIDSLPGEYTIHTLYLALNYVGGMVVSTMEHNRELLMKQTGGSA